MGVWVVFGDAQVWLFRTAPPASLKKVAALFSQRTLTAGSTLFKPGDVGDCCYVVVAGVVKVEWTHEAEAQDPAAEVIDVEADEAAKPGATQVQHTHRDPSLPLSLHVTISDPALCSVHLTLSVLPPTGGDDAGLLRGGRRFWGGKPGCSARPSVRQHRVGFKQRDGDGVVEELFGEGDGRGRRAHGGGAGRDPNEGVHPVGALSAPGACSNVPSYSTMRRQREAVEALFLAFSSCSDTTLLTLQYTVVRRGRIGYVVSLMRTTITLHPVGRAFSPQVWIFSLMSDAQLQLIATYFESSILDTGTQLSLRNSLYIVGAGCLSFTRKVAERATQTLTASSLSTLGELDVLGLHPSDSAVRHPLPPRSPPPAPPAFFSTSPHRLVAAGCAGGRAGPAHGGVLPQGGPTAARLQ